MQHKNGVDKRQEGKKHGGICLCASNILGIHRNASTPTTTTHIGQKANERIEAIYVVEFRPN